eukprot:gene19453-26116_t
MCLRRTRATIQSLLLPTSPNAASGEVSDDVRVSSDQGTRSISIDNKVTKDKDAAELRSSESAGGQPVSGTGRNDVLPTIASVPTPSAATRPPFPLRLYPAHSIISSPYLRPRSATPVTCLVRPCSLIDCTPCTFPATPVPSL